MSTGIVHSWTLSKKCLQNCSTLTLFNRRGDLGLLSQRVVPHEAVFSAIMYNANKIYRMAVSRKRTTGWHPITIIRRLSAAEIWCVWYRDNGPHRLILLATWRDQTVVSLQDGRSVYAVAILFFINLSTCGRHENSPNRILSTSVSVIFIVKQLFHYDDSLKHLRLTLLKRRSDLTETFKIISGTWNLLFNQ